MTETCEIVLSNRAVAGAFDEALHKCLPPNQQAEFPPDVLLNMWGLKFTDLQNMQRIICFVEYCKQKGSTIRLRLPENLKLIRFWHSWNFFETIENVADISIEDLVSSDQHESLIYDGRHSPDDETVRLLAPNVTPSRRRNFFSFYTEKIEDSTRVSIPSRERNFWEREEVIDVLHRVFGENSGDNIGSDIVSETLFNSTRHSDATILSSASFCQKDPGEGGRRSFQLVIWDNGEPIYETLRKPLTEGKSVREYAAENFRERNYLVTYPEFPNATMHSSHTAPIKKEDKDSKLMLAALYPGVTSKPFSDLEVALGETASKAEIRIQRGMGFDFVLETAIHGLGGSVSIRSGRYFAKIKKVKEDQMREHIRMIDSSFQSSPTSGKLKPVPQALLKKYEGSYFSISFREIPSNVPPFNGNLIFISV